MHEGRLRVLRVVHFAVKVLQHRSSICCSFLQLLIPGSCQDLHIMPTLMTFSVVIAFLWRYLLSCHACVELRSLGSIFRQACLYTTVCQQLYMHLQLCWSSRALNPHFPPFLYDWQHINAKVVTEKDPAFICSLNNLSPAIWPSQQRDPFHSEALAGQLRPGLRRMLCCHRLWHSEQMLQPRQAVLHCLPVALLLCCVSASPNLHCRPAAQLHHLFILSNSHHTALLQ